MSTSRYLLSAALLVAAPAFAEYIARSTPPPVN